MKKSILSLVAMVLLSLSSVVSAGAVKEVLIDAEDTIHHEFFQNGLQVISIEDQELVPSKRGVGVKAVVVTRNPTSKVQQVWTCVVDFARINNSYESVDINCK